MTAKEYLRQLWCLDRKINIKCLELEKLKAERGIRYIPDNSDHVIGSGYPTDHVADTAIDLMELDRYIDKQVKKYIELKKTIIAQIEGMDNQLYQDILTCRYILMMSWADVAQTMKYDIRHCTRLHGRALQAFATQYMS